MNSLDYIVIGGAIVSSESGTGTISSAQVMASDSRCEELSNKLNKK